MGKGRAISEREKLKTENGKRKIKPHPHPRPTGERKDNKMGKKNTYEAKLKADLDAKFKDRQAKITAYEKIVETFDSMLTTEKNWQVREYLIEFYNDFYSIVDL